MTSRLLTPTLLALALLTACGGKNSADEATLKEAGEIHLQASEIQEALEPQVDSLAALKTKLAALKTSAATQAVADIDSVVSRFEAWESNVVEVPGMEHKHEHAEGDSGHHHHHDHKPAPQVTASEMLDIQKEMKSELEKISTDAKTVLESGRKAL